MRDILKSGLTQNNYKMHQTDTTPPAPPKMARVYICEIISVRHHWLGSRYVLFNICEQTWGGGWDIEAARDF